MKRYHFIAAAVLLACSTLAASASIPVAPSFESRWAQGSGDNYQFNPAIRVQAQTAPAPTSVATTVANGTPIVVTAPAPGGFPDIIASIQAAISALIAALLAKIGFTKPTGLTPAAGVTTVAATPTDVGTIVSSVIARLSGGPSTISDPSIRAAVDNALSQVIQTGIPGTALTTALGMIPGAAPFVAVGEPALRKLVLQVLAEREAANSGTTAAPGATVAVPTNILSDIAAALKGLAPKAA